MVDPIVEEVRKLREEHAARFNFDVDGILADFKRIERERGWAVVTVPPKRIVKHGPHAVPATGESNTVR